MKRFPKLPDTYVLIVNGAPVEMPSALLEHLVSGASSVLACDSGAEQLVCCGLYPDILVGDMDSIDENARRACKDAGVTFEQIPVRKDVSDFCHALAMARKSGAGHVVVCATLGGRLDQTLAVVGELAQAADLHPIVVDSHEIVAVVDAGRANCVKLSDLGLEPGDTFSVFAVRPQTRITEIGVSYPVRDVEFQPFSSLGLSNVMTEPDAAVTCTGGCALIVVSGSA